MALAEEKRVKLERHETPIVLIQVSCRSNLTLLSWLWLCQVLAQLSSPMCPVISVSHPSIVELSKLWSQITTMVSHGAFISP